MATVHPTATPLPRPVIAFELLSVAMLAAEVITGAGIASGSAFSDLFSLLFMLALVLAITRGRSRLARWAFTLLYALGFVFMILLFWKGLLRPGSVTLIAWLLSGAATVQLALLWSGATTAWLRRQRTAV
jgi:hypothetical protein